MAVGIDDVLGTVGGRTVLIGLGIAAAAPLLIYGFGKGARPVAKVLIHRYLDLAEKLKEVGAETQEQWKDLLAEVQVERQQALTRSPAEVSATEV